MPTTAQVSSGGSTVNSTLYEGRIEKIKAKILVEEDSNPIATSFEVNKRFNGQFFVNARFRNVGSLPNGISWVSDNQGIRFFGVPQQTGIFEALFEGPYPDNFVGTSTSGNSTVVCQTGPQTPTTGVQSAQVFGFAIRFEVTTKTANSLTFGQAFRNILKNPSTTLSVYREGWAPATVLTVPTAPVLSSALGVDGGISITFTAPSDNGGSPITGYDYSLDGGATWATNATLVAGQLYTISNLINGRTYQVRVRGKNAIGVGQASNTLVAVPFRSAVGVYQTMKVLGSLAQFGVWNLAQAVPMARISGATSASAYQWTVSISMPGAPTSSGVFKFLVGPSWDDPATPNFTENWGDNAPADMIGDPGGANIVLPIVASQHALVIRFNEITFAYDIGVAVVQPNA